MLLLPAVVAAGALLLPPDGGLVTWRLGEADRGEDRALPVGSLQKPFVAEAWARSHAGQTPPTFRCEAASGCWRKSGHGSLGLERALAVSCNTYFLRLAADVPAEALESTFSEEGFVVPHPLSPEGAIGLPHAGGTVLIRPARLLEAYSRLVRTPWLSSENLRQAVLDGLRLARWEGTAVGLEKTGPFAKTGTVAALDGHPLATSGWAIQLDEGGGGVLGLLPRGTGSAAARALGQTLDSPSEALPSRSERVRVHLFAAFHASRLFATNAGPSPVALTTGFVGPGSTVELRLGLRLSAGLWDLRVGTSGLVRRVAGALACRGPLELVAEVTPLEYVSGVLLGELPTGADFRRRVDLGAAVLRFVSGGPRHGDVDFCDTTHCAWFVGRGPRVRWSSPTRFAVLGPPQDAQGEGEALDPSSWARIQEEAGRSGPRLWTAHCGGTPLSGHFLWGNGDHSVVACTRHAGTSPAPWTRRWTTPAVERAFGTASPLEVTQRDGVWTLRVGDKDLRFDEAHRRLATVLGWDALPSPADRVDAVEGGYEVRGVGFGHRVGLCLGD